MKSEIPEPKFLSVPEAAKICGVSRNTVYMWVRQSKLLAYQTPGRTNLIRPSDLVNFMESNGMFVPNSLTEMAQSDERLMDLKSSKDVVTPKDSMCSILVVDDDPMSRSLAVRALKEIGQVYQAETGYEALHIITMHNDISIVLLDLRMPGQHGLDTLKEIRNNNSDISVLVVSGFAADLPEDIVTSGQAAKIIEKPVTVQQLQEAVVEANEKMQESKA